MAKHHETFADIPDTSVMAGGKEGFGMPSRFKRSVRHLEAAVTRQLQKKRSTTEIETQEIPQVPAQAVAETR